MVDVQSFINRLKRPGFAQDVFSSTLSRGVYIGLGFVSSVLLARLLEPDGRGVFAAIMVVPQLFSVIVDAGLRQSTTYFVGKEILPVERVAGVLLLLFIPLSIIGMALSAGAYILQDLIKYGWLVLFPALLWIPVAMLKSYSVGVNMGLRRIRQVNYGEVAFAALNVFLIVCLIWLLNAGVRGAVLAIIVATFAQGAVMANSYMKDYGVSFKELQGLPKLLITKGIVYGFSLFLLQFIHRLDVFFLNEYASKQDLGIFIVALSLIDLLLHIPHILGSVTFSHSANAKDLDNFTLKNWKLIKLTSPIGLLGGIALCAIAPFFVPYLYGDDYVQVSALMWYLMPGVAAIMPSKLMRSEISAGRGRPELVIYISFAIIIVKIILSFLLIPQHGIYGAAIASSISLIIFLLVILVIYRGMFLRKARNARRT